jgi:hypothetical protein
MARVKGTAVKSTVAFLHERLGEGGYIKLIQSLPPEDSQALSRAILQGDWYQFSMLVDLMQAAERVLPPTAGRPLAWELGRHSAEYGLSTVYKVFFRVADLGFILKRVQTLFPTYYDSGVMALVENEHHSAAVRITGFDQWCTLFCDRLQGWIERTVELSGSKRVHVSHPTCAARGGPHCEIRAEWS